MDTRAGDEDVKPYNPLVTGVGRPDQDALTVLQRAAPEEAQEKGSIALSDGTVVPFRPVLPQDGMGRPDEEIVVLGEEKGAGLIVAGSRGLGGMRRALVG